MKTLASGFLCLIWAISFHFSNAQVVCNSTEIISLPPDLVSFDINKLDPSLDKLITYLDHIYRSKKLDTINENTYTYKKSPEERWPAGSWGNGYFTANVEKHAYVNGTDITTRYQTWYNDAKNSGYNGCRPMVREAARIIIGYINIYGKGIVPDADIKEKITYGVRFLLDEQIESPNHTFYWWASRPDINVPNNGCDTDKTASSLNWKVKFKTREEQYDAGLALEALANAYLFFQVHSIDIENEQQEPLFTLDEIETSITNCADWMKGFAANHHWYYDSNNDETPECQNKSHTRPTNQLSFSISGLINAYRITRDASYLESAINSYERSINSHQLQDGAWTYYDCKELILKYHDSQGHYTGIILRNLIELYDLISCTRQSVILSSVNGQEKNSQENLKEKIICTINHFLQSDMTRSGRTRLNQTGLIEDYSAYEEAHDRAVEWELIDAMVYLQRSNLYKEFSELERQKVDAILRAMLKPALEELMSSKGITKADPPLAFRTLSYVKEQLSVGNPNPAHRVVLYSPTGDAGRPNRISLFDFNSKEQFGYSNVGGFFDLMTTGNFDTDAEDEIAFYQKSNGKISIYNPGYLEYTGCKPVYVKTIQTEFYNCDMMRALKYNNAGPEEIVLYSTESNGLMNRIDIYDVDTKERLSTGYSNSGSIFNLMTCGNFDDDGQDELAFYRQSDGRISIYNPDVATSNGTATYTGSSPVYGGSINTGFKLHDLMETIDYDGGGPDEIMMYNRYYSGNYNRIDILGLNGYRTSKYSNAGGVFLNLSTGDFDGDGKDEAAFYNNADGKISIYNPEYSETNTPVAYTGNPPIYAGSIYTNFTGFTMMSALRSGSNLNLQIPRVKAEAVDNSTTEFSATQPPLLAFPNPTATSVTLQYFLKEKGMVAIHVTDLLGRNIGTVNLGEQAEGYHEHEYSKPNGFGGYLFRLSVNSRITGNVKVMIQP